MKIELKHLKFLEEIRLRAYKPLIIENRAGEWFVDRQGNLLDNFINSYIVSHEDVLRTLELVSENSIYAYQDEIKNGYITLRGGHRIGIVGRIILEGKNLKTIKDISGLNIRVSKEVYGCGTNVIKYIIRDRVDVYNTLIVSPPQCGKTTLLRDITRLISDGVDEYGFKGMKVGVVDERSEIAACYKGIAQNNVGIRTDVLDSCPKSIGMTLLLRTMSPKVIITDEIGNEGDKDAILQLINAGVKIITTAHGYTVSELKSRQEVLKLIEEKVFDRFIVLNRLKGAGTIKEILDGHTMNIIYRSRE